MVEEKKVDDFFVNGLDRNRDVVDFLVLLYDGLFFLRYIQACFLVIEEKIAEFSRIVSR